MTTSPRHPSPEELPRAISRLIDQVVGSLAPDDAREVREDLEQHFRDGRAAGRSTEDLIARFGDPAVAVTSLRDARRARSRGRSTRGSGGGAGFFDSLALDARFALRSWRKNPSVTLVVTLVLAVGIGANALAFTILSELVLRPLPIADPASVVDVKADVPGGNSFTGFSYQDVVALQERNDVLTGVAAFSGLRLRFGENRTSDLIAVSLVSPGYFQLLGVDITIGRSDFPPTTRFGADALAVVSHGFWQGSLGSDPEVIGSSIVLNGRSVTVIGVAERGFTGTFIGFPMDVWLPLSMADPFVPGFDPTDRSNKLWEMVGRLKPGVSVEAADAGLDAVAAGIEREHPIVNRGHAVSVSPTTGIDEGWRGGVLGFVGILVALTAFVLMIACLNVGSILLVRAMTREREMTIRLAVGAGGGRLVRQLLTEVALLMILGTGVGMLAANRVLAVLRDFFTSITGGLRLELALDWRAFVLTTSVVLLATMVAGLAPATHLFRKDPADALRGGSGGKRGVRLRSALVVAQVGLSVVLVTATALFVRTVQERMAADVGFAAERVSGFTLMLDEARYEPEQGRVLQRTLVEALARLESVESVTLATSLPVGVARSPMEIQIPGLEPPPGATGFVVDVKSAGGEYFTTLGLPLRAGRDFSAADERDSLAVAIVNSAFAERFFPVAAAVGRSIETPSGPVRIVGVAEDSRYIPQDDTTDPLVYLALAGRYRPSLAVLLRTDVAGGTIASSVQGELDRLDPDQPLVTLRSVSDLIAQGLVPQRIGVAIIGVMGALALLLAAVGLYGLVQFSVTQDTRELGIRLALGGERSHVSGLVLRRGFALVAMGAAGGLGVTFALAPALDTFLISAQPTDPAIYGTVLATFATVALLACLLPAQRAARIAPSEALRAD